RLCIGHPECRPALPYTSNYLSDNYLDPHIEKYNCMYWQKVLKRTYWEHPDRVRHDYWTAIKTYPLWLARVKIGEILYNFRENRCLRIWPAMWPNEYDLRFNSRFQRERDWLIATATGTFSHRWLKWIFTKHLVWFTINSVGVFLFLVAWRVSRNRQL